MVEIKQNFSRGVLVRLVIVLALVTAILVFNADFITNVYLRNQLTPTGWITNGGILALFLLGLVRIVLILRRYMNEERALNRLVHALKNDHPDPATGLDRGCLIAFRYHAILTLSQDNAPVNHAALASTQVARESTLISLPKFVNNILILTGVFGTIVSLSIALVGASNVLDAPQQGPGSMGMVIHGMSTALSTTITAIVCYLIYGYFYLKLTDAQTYIFSQIEEVTTLYLIPRYSHTPEDLVQRVTTLVKELNQVTLMMRTAQADSVEVSNKLHGLIADLDQRTAPMAEDLEVIKAILREGFRLPESGAP